MYSRMGWFCALILYLSPASALAGNSASAAIAFTFQEVNEIAITGTPNLEINTVTAGQQPDTVIDDTIRYAISTNGENKRVMASLDTPMPPGTTLEVKFAKPSGTATTLNYVSLSTTPTEVLNGISHVADATTRVIYRLSASIDAQPLTDTRVVTITLTD